MANRNQYRGRPRTFLKPGEKVEDKAQYHKDWVKRNKQSAVCKHCGATINNKYNMTQHYNTRYCTELRQLATESQKAPATQVQLPQDIVSHILSYVPRDRDMMSPTAKVMKIYFARLQNICIKNMDDIDWKIFSVMLESGIAEHHRLRYIEQLEHYRSLSLEVAGR